MQAKPEREPQVQAKSQEVATREPQVQVGRWTQPSEQVEPVQQDAPPGRRRRAPPQACMGATARGPPLA